MIKMGLEGFLGEGYKNDDYMRVSNYSSSSVKKIR